MFYRWLVPGADDRQSLIARYSRMFSALRATNDHKLTPNSLGRTGRRNGMQASLTALEAGRAALQQVRTQVRKSPRALWEGWDRICGCWSLEDKASRP